MLADTYRGFEYSAVAAIHTRNEAGEIHYHAHVLLGKFAKNLETGRTVSLNSKAGGNTGARVADLKRSWKRNVDQEMQASLGIKLTQSAAYARPTLQLPDGSTLAPLTRETRRMLEKKLEPVVTERDKYGNEVQKKFRINDAMDGAIFEVAAHEEVILLANSPAIRVRPVRNVAHLLLATTAQAMPSRQLLLTYKL